MFRPSCLLCLVAAFCFLSAPSHAGDEDGAGSGTNPPAFRVGDGLEFRIFPVLSLVEPYRNEAFPVFGRSLYFSGGTEDLLIWSANSRMDAGEDNAPLSSLFPVMKGQPMNPVNVVEWIHASTPSSVWEKGEGSIQFTRGRMYVAQERGVLDAIEKMVEQMRLRIAPRFACRFIQYEIQEGEEEPAGSHLSLQDAEALFQRVTSGRHGKLMFQGEAQARPGDVLHFGKRQEERFLADLDVEIAQKASVVEPVMGGVQLGQDLNVLPVLCPDGKSLALFCLFTSRDLSNPVGKMDLGVGGYRIERAKVEQIQTAFSACLHSSGGGIVVKNGGMVRPGLRALVLFRRLDALPGSASGGPVVIPTGLLSFPILTTVDGSLAGIFMEPTIDVDFVQEMIAGAAGRKERKAITSMKESQYLILLESAGLVESAGKFARFLGRDLTRNFLVEIIREGRQVQDRRGVWVPIGKPVRIPCLGNRLGFAMDGVEENYVSDYDVEVAQEEKAADPAIRTCFNGIQAVVAVDLRGKGCHVQLSMLDRSILGLRQVSPGSPDLGYVEVPDVREVVLKRNILLEPGTTYRLGEGPLRELPGKGRFRTRLSLRLTEVK